MAEIQETNFNFPGQVGEVYHGKVGDTYTIDHEHGQLLAVVRTDRVSAFDAKLPRLIPYKGQVLNQMAAKLLETTSDISPNWLIDSPDPNVSIGYKADPVKVEMIMRGNLLGTAWRNYENGMREICGNVLPDGMSEFQAFEQPLLTPTTKAEKDADITLDEIVEQGLATQNECRHMAKVSFALFTRGQQMAADRGLIMPDTKYEFGRLKDGSLIVIDEIHTPDSSRYFDKDSFDAYLDGLTEERPKQRSKEFVREWLIAHGFMNQPGEAMPEMPDEFVQEVSDRYIDLYQSMMGERFRPAYSEDPISRIGEAVLRCLKNLEGSKGA